ncbi:MAG: exo-alpha-sialidase [Opitutaceae bacterium]|nr:exo-alpha-sialidase [Opitutaceae bacterium]
MPTTNLTRRDWFKTATLMGACTALPLRALGKAKLDWVDQPTQQLKGLRVTCSEPVLVKRSKWFCWFPSLIRQLDGTLWASMSAYADVAASNSVDYLSRSRDGGLTWDEPRIIADAGEIYLLLSDGRAVIIPYYLRPKSADTIGAPCNVIMPDGQLTMIGSGVTVGGWPKPPAVDADLGIAQFSFNGQVERGRKGEFLTTLYGKFVNDKRYSLIFAESADGFAWHIRSIVAGPEYGLESEEGPCESAVSRLRDGRLMCIFRVASYVNYGQTFSEDDGQTWTKAEAILAKSVQPSLAVMPDGVIALSGGRPGIFVWFNSSAGLGEWQSIDIQAQHNAAHPNDSINLIPAAMRHAKSAELIKQGLSGFTSSYSELIRLDERHLLMIYDRAGLGWNTIPDESPETNSVWVMRLTVES